MLILRYKTLVDFPGSKGVDIPAGEILEYSTGSHGYRGTVATDFWADNIMVENDPARFALFEVIKDEGTPVFNEGIDQAQKANTEITEKIAALQESLTAAGVATVITK